MSTSASASPQPGGLVVTRFAPSPTGDLHLGNARTALFNLLLARRTGGRLLLRIEDTDSERSLEAHTQGLMADLRWLGIAWDAGPDREDERGPYRQSQRAPLYAQDLAALERAGAVYPCFCTALELELSRRAQLAAGRAPRYGGACRELTAAERARRLAAGVPAALRFRVPPGERIAFVDLVHGPQSFLSDDIGDFVVRRADGTAAFFFSNAVDDARMGVTLVLRGEDHLANTPRQLLILAALGLAAPAYGHVALLVGADGAPLSKRHGAVSVRDYRERGYLPEAIVNHLFRLGHSSPLHGLLTLTEMVHAFDPAHLGRAPARFDEQQLRVWQKDAVHRLSVAASRTSSAAAGSSGGGPPKTISTHGRASSGSNRFGSTAAVKAAAAWLSSPGGSTPASQVRAAATLRRCTASFCHTRSCCSSKRAGARPRWAGSKACTISVSVSSP